MKDQRLLAKRVGRFSMATLISRVLGYARDASVAHFFGGGHLTDIFYTAFRTSNLFRRLLGEGALSSSFVPVFSNSLKNEPRQETQEFLNAIFTVLLIALVLLTILGVVFAPQLTLLIAPGFKSSPDKFEMTVLITRTMFPFFLFISLAALLAGVLNSLKHFFLPAVAPALLSVSEIVYLFGFLRQFDPQNQMVGLSIAVVAGGAAHFFAQLPLLIREKFYLKLSFRWKHPRLIQVGQFMVPAVIGLSADQINAFVDTVCATFLAGGSVTALYNSNRLMQLPLALFGISIASVTLPMMSEHTAEKNFEKLSETLNTSLRMMIYTVTPAAAGLIALSHPIVSLLFQHGQFTSDATALTVSALLGYAIGLPAFACVKLFANVFYSLHRPSIPVKVAGFCMVIHILLNLLLMGPAGVGGLAFSTSFSSWVNALWLYGLIRSHLKKGSNESIKTLDEPAIARTLLKTLSISLTMSLCLWWFLALTSSFGTLLKVLIGMAIGLTIFIIFSRLLRMEEQKIILSMIGIKENIED